MNLTAERKWNTLLFNPFAYIAGSEALGIGIVGFILASFFGGLGNTHFDGVLDTHTGQEAPWWIFFAENIVNWLSLAVVLWCMGLLVSRTAFRVVDLFGTQAMARWPAVLIALLTLVPAYQRFVVYLKNFVLKFGSKPPIQPFDAAYFAFAAALMLALLVWMVALMWKSYSISCNVRGGKAVSSFIIGLLIAEVLSKVVIGHLFKLV